MTTLSLLASFDGSDGASPKGALIADANGDLFGVTSSGGANGDGAVFELKYAGTAGSASYAATPTLIASFDGANGAAPEGALVADANGDLFGVTSFGGANGDGGVFELQNTGTVSAPSYASTPTLIASFNGSNGSSPQGALIADANGDLFGVTSLGGANGDGAVFELQNTGTVSAPSYASTPTLLASFNGSNGSSPQGALIADANGDLFGVTSAGGANGDGAVFELQNTGTVSAPSYAPTPTLLASFDGSNGSTPQGPLVADANGDLFGVTSSGGANGDGAVFELQNTGTVSAPSYASAPTTLFSFDGVDGATPQGGLVIDSSGDLFGVTSSGGANGDGVAFELPPSAVSSPTALLSFDSSNGSSPLAGLYAGPNGGLYGATSAGGANGDGSVFELPTSSLSPSDVLFLELSALAEEFRGGLHGWNALLMEWAIADSASAFQQSQTFVYTGPSAAFSGASQFYGASPSGLADLTSLAKSSVENISPSGSML